MRVAVESLLPHRTPLCWIDFLVDCSETLARAETTFGIDHFAVTNGWVEEAAFIECVAQTAAAALGYRSRQRGITAQPAAGMLAAISNFRVEKPVPAGKTFVVEVRDLKRFGPMLLVAGTVACDGEPIASGELTLYA